MTILHSRHGLGYCPTCDCDFVKCVTCGNNCCNGGSGEIDGKKCTDCLEAYDHQDLYWKSPESIQFAKDLREEHRNSPLNLRVLAAKKLEEETGEPLDWGKIMFPSSDEKDV